MAIDRVRGADHRQPRGQAGPAPVRAAAAARKATATSSGRAGSDERLVGPGHGVAVGIDAFGDDALLRDADRERYPGVAGQGIVRAHRPRPRPPRALTGIRHQARPGRQLGCDARSLFGLETPVSAA